MIPSQITIARSVVAIGVLAFLFIASLAPPAAHGALIIIQNTSDSGPGSLRQAIMDAAPQTSISFISVFDCDSHLYIDQRGVQRPQGPTCDIGAVEVKGATANRIWGNNLCDGTIGSDDAIAMLFYVGGAPWQHSNDCTSVGSLISVSGQFDYGFWADVNCDGTINGIDIVNVLRAALLLSTQQGQQCPAIGDHVPVIG
jgi:hypothetical protein